MSEVKIKIVVKHSKKICSVCGGHFISMNFPPRDWEGYSAYSPRVQEIQCLLLKGRREIMPTYRCKTVPLLKSRHKNPLKIGRIQVALS
jgi:hypothetical protein